MKPRLIKIVVMFCAATLLGSVSIIAQDVNFKDYRLDAKAVKGSSVSNLDLIRKIFPDARIEKGDPEAATASKSIPLRHLFGGDKEISGGAMTLNIAQRQQAVGGSGEILWLIINAVHPDKSGCADCFKASWTATILAAFRVSKTTAELLDAAEIETENITAFDEDHPKLRLQPSLEAVAVWNVSTASVGRDELWVVAADEKGFRILLDRFTLQKDFRCAEWFSEEAKLRVLKTTGGGFRRLEISVLTEGGPGDADYPTVKYRRQFRYVFAWQMRRQRYEAALNPDRERRAFLKRLEPCQDQK